MKTILVLGAGRSSSSLITYLLGEAYKNNWKVIVGDTSIEASQQKVASHANGQAIRFNIEEQNDLLFEAADIVVSLLPPPFHPLVAVQCLKFGKHMLTASYVSDEMKGLGVEAQEKDLIFMNECGLDPGIDHMSAMQIIDSITSKGGKLLSFESFTGGLIAPETDPGNPWRYKFTWNPRNVVMAGQGTAKFLRDGNYKYLPYQRLFSEITSVNVPGYGDYEGYANRDSLKYIDTYGLKDIKTMLRGTLRNKGFCAAWNVLVQLGCCDDTYEMESVSTMTHADFLNSFLDGSGKNVAEKVKSYTHIIKGAEIEFLDWSGFFSNDLVGLVKGTPAQILEHILNKKWKLNAEDKDQIVMWHRFVFDDKGKKREIQASLVATGNDSVYTAMAKTVGLPLGISTKLILQNKIKARGVVIPTIPEIYNPVLDELKSLGIELQEREIAPPANQTFF
jgi:saccharopine dehydrogenase-like NADP-dependent oxidoreductase